jgi:hypothetical protein
MQTEGLSTMRHARKTLHDALSDPIAVGVFVVLAVASVCLVIPLPA